jgi:hypothetical protein
MIHEFAVDPGLLCNFEQIRYLAEKFSFQQGRLISRYPKKWERMVYEALAKTNQGAQLTRIEIMVKKIKQEKMITRAHEWQDKLDWLQNAELEYARQAFRAILAANNPRSHEGVLPYEDLTEDTTLWAMQSQRVVRREAIELVTTLGPIFRSAKRLIFIDPYLSTTAGSNSKALRAYLNYCKSLPNYPAIEFHTCDRGNVNFQSECDNLRALIPVGKKVTFRYLGQQAGADGLHNRYVLTDRGGVSFGWGVIDGKPGELDDVGLLELDVYKLRFAQYCGDPPAFIAVLTFSVEGTAPLEGNRAT